MTGGERPPPQPGHRRNRLPHRLAIGVAALPIVGALAFVAGPALRDAIRPAEPAQRIQGLLSTTLRCDGRCTTWLQDDVLTVAPQPGPRRPAPAGWMLSRNELGQTQLRRSRPLMLNIISTNLLVLRHGVLQAVCQDLRDIVIDPESTVSLDYPRGAVTATTPPTQATDAAAGRQLRRIRIQELAAAGDCDVQVDVLGQPARQLPASERLAQWLGPAPGLVLPVAIPLLIWTTRRRIRAASRFLFQRFWIASGPRHRQRQTARHRRTAARDGARYGRPDA